MKGLRYLVAVAAVAFTMPAQAAVGDPEVVLYRAAGVLDDNSGFASAFYCTPFSGVSENIRIVVRGQNGALLANVATTISHLNTGTWATRDIQLYSTDVNLATGPINIGTVAIAATSTSVTCTAVQVQFATSGPITVPLHMTRFNPLAGTQE
jgi:hypothetical protein